MSRTRRGVRHRATAPRWRLTTVLVLVLWINRGHWSADQALSLGGARPQFLTEELAEGSMPKSTSSSVTRERRTPEAHAHLDSVTEQFVAFTAVVETSPMAVRQ